MRRVDLALENRVLVETRLEVHSAAGWHSAARHGWLGLLRDERRSRQDHACDRYCVLNG